MRQMFIVQFRVVTALVLRETKTTFGKSKIGYLWAFLVPTFGVIIIVAIFSSFNRQPPLGSSLALFFALGLFTLELYRKLTTSLMLAFEANRPLLTYPLIKKLDTLLARGILIASTYTVIFLIFFLSLTALDLADPPFHLETLLSGFSTIILFGFSMGALNAVILSLWNSWKRIEPILTKPLFFISGIFYLPSQLPPEVINILKWNPVLHLVEWMRSGYYANYDSSILSKTYPLSLSLFFLVVAFGGERLWRRRMV